MNMFIASAVYCILINAIAHGVEIEPGFPTDCGIPDVQREYKEEAEVMKVTATPHSWPWHVGIWSRHYGFFPYCGGTLISNSLILTSAHCIQNYFICTRFPVGTEIHLTEDLNQALLVLVGAHDYTKGDGNEQLFSVQRAIIHPNYNQDAKLHGTDLAILKLKGQIQLNAAVKNICFPSSRVKLSKGSLCFYTGWGKMYTEWSQGQLIMPKVLKEAQIEVDFDEPCMREFRAYNNVRKSCIKTVGTSPCNGDSGGGLFCPSEDDNSWFWYGAIGSARADCLGHWAVVNNVSSVHSWIRDSALFLGL